MCALRDARQAVFEAIRPEVETQLQLELRDVQEGKLRDSILLRGMAHNMPFSRFTTVARNRGRNWRFLSALSDATLQVEGFGMQRLMTQIVGDNLLLNACQRAITTILRLEVLAAQYADHPRIRAMLEDAIARAQQTPQQVVADYWADIRRVWG